MVARVWASQWQREGSDVLMVMFCVTVELPRSWLSHWNAVLQKTVAGEMRLATSHMEYQHSISHNFTYMKNWPLKKFKVQDDKLYLILEWGVLILKEKFFTLYPHSKLSPIFNFIAWILSRSVVCKISRWTNHGLQGVENINVKIIEGKQTNKTGCSLPELFNVSLIPYMLWGCSGKMPNRGCSYHERRENYVC